MDMTRWHRAARHMVAGISAFRETIYRTGRGEIVVSKRNPYGFEKSRVVHGKAIANMLAAKGGDVFIVDPQVERDAYYRLEGVVHRIIELAIASGRPQHRLLRKVMREVTQEVLRSILENIAQGRTPKEKSAKYAAKIKSMSERGYGAIDNRFGMPPPWGVKTGRFFDGIKARMGRSKAALRSVYDSGL